MSALRTYRTLPAAAGWWFLVVALLGRLPMAMMQIGSLLLVSATTGSLAAGGASAACLALGQAIGGPLVGRLADSTGHRAVGLVTAVLQAGAVVALVIVVGADRPLPTVLVTAFLAGITGPQVGPLARARWAGIVHHGRAPASAFPTAMSYEGAADETTFVLGPALVGVVVAVAGAPAAMLLAAGITAVFGVGFALHWTATLVGRHDKATYPDRAVRDRPALLLLAAMLFCTGLFFASVQAGVTAMAVAAGAAGSAGLVYGAMGVVSATAGLLTPALPQRFSLAWRLLVFPSVLLVSIVPLLLIGRADGPSLWLLCVAVMVTGAAVAPTLITAFSVGERTVPLSRVSWAMTVLASGVVLGYATAAVTGGALAQAHGAVGAYALTFVAVLVAVVIAAIGRRRFARLTEPEPHSEAMPVGSGRGPARC